MGDSVARFTLLLFITQTCEENVAFKFSNVELIFLMRPYLLLFGQNNVPDQTLVHRKAGL